MGEEILCTQYRPGYTLLVGQFTILNYKEGAFEEGGEL
jgi:hypothetical protein